MKEEKRGLSKEEAAMREGNEKEKERKMNEGRKEEGAVE